MEEQTTTEAPVATGGTIQGVPVNDQGQAIPQPDAPEQAEAAPTTETPQEQAEASAPEAQEPAKADNSTAEWLKNKGIDPSSPEAIEKVAEMARNAEKAMHQKATKASELEKAIDQQVIQEASDTGLSDDDKLRLARLEVRTGVRDWFDGNPEAKPYEQAMIEELAKRPHLAGDLDSLYAVAVVNSGKLGEVKSQGGREALESLAQKQQASTPAGNATNGAVFTSDSITPQNVWEQIDKHDQAWFEKNYQSINRAISGK